MHIGACRGDEHPLPRKIRLAYAQRNPFVGHQGFCSRFGAGGKANFSACACRVQARLSRLDVRLRQTIRCVAAVALVPTLPPALVAHAHKVPHEAQILNTERIKLLQIQKIRAKLRMMPFVHGSHEDFLSLANKRICLSWANAIPPLVPSLSQRENRQNSYAQTALLAVEGRKMGFRGRAIGKQAYSAPS